MSPRSNAAVRETAPPSLPPPGPVLLLLLLWALPAGLFSPGCGTREAGPGAAAPAPRKPPPLRRGGPAWEARRSERRRMVKRQIEARGVKDPRVLRALGEVPRHLFVPEPLRDRAYADTPLPIGEGQTISQPYIVALMTEALEPEPGDRVLEIGTGSGYQAAVLAELVKEVYTIEIVPSLGEAARERLRAMGYENIHVRIGDGYRGWPEAAPFDGIVVTAAPDHVPPALVEQLKPGAHLVIPVGADFQRLKRITKGAEGIVEETLLDVLFVPMTGEAENR